MADSFTATLNLTKPEVGAALSTWGGSLNGDLDLLDAIFLATGLGTPVGLHIGPTQVLNCEGTPLFADSTDTTKAACFDSSLITTGTLRTFQFPDESGVLAIAQSIPTGTVYSGYYGTVAPAGFVLLAGKTIGDASSGATARANADCVNLFTLLWNITANAQCPVTPGGHGASAAADWAAHKALKLPDHRGCVMAALDNLGGSNAHQLDSYIASTTRGASGGVQTAGIQGLTGGNFQSLVASNLGATTVQPTIMVDVIIAL